MSVLFDHFNDAGNVSASGETTLYTDTIPAGKLAANGDKIVAIYRGTFYGAGASTNFLLKVYFGGTKIGDINDDSGPLGGLAGWAVTVEVIRVSATVVRCSVAYNGLSTSTNSPFYTEVTGLTLANTQILKITGDSSGGTPGNNDVIARFGSVGYLPKAG